MNPLFNSHLSTIPLIHQGKVRDIYAVDDHHLLIVATDRLSAFDVVLPTPIPNKGKILTALSLFWFDFTRSLVPNQLADLRVSEVITNADERNQLRERAIIVRKLKPLPIEAIVRGYLVGSGWKEYQQTGSVCGIDLPLGLQQAQELPQAIYTPSTKAALGLHDENINFTQTVDLLGEKLANQVKELSLAIYTNARRYAARRGIIIADTKFEFGTDENGKVYLIDEVLTPDSSRFWPISHYATGMSPPSFDKQFVRDYLETLDWDKKPPAPMLPDDIVQKTAEKYLEALKTLTNEG